MDSESADSRETIPGQLDPVMPEQLDPSSSEQLWGAVDGLRETINGLYDRVRDTGADSQITCGDVVDEVGAAVDRYLESTEAFANRASTTPGQRAVLAPLDVCAAADVAPFLAFETVDSRTYAIGITFQVRLPHEAEALTTLAPPPPGPEQVALHIKAGELVDKFVERATRSTVRVLVGGAAGLGHLATVLAQPFPGLHQQLTRLGGHIRRLLERAITIMSSHIGAWPKEIAAYVDAFEPVKKLEERLVGTRLKDLFKADEVQKKLAQRADLAASGIDEKLLKKLNKANKRRVEWVGTVAPIALGSLSAVTLGGVVPALPVAVAVLLLWIMLVTADQLAAPVTWRLHVFRGIPGNSPHP